MHRDDSILFIENFLRTKIDTLRYKKSCFPNKVLFTCFLGFYYITLHNGDGKSISLNKFLETTLFKKCDTYREILYPGELVN